MDRESGGAATPAVAPAPPLATGHEADPRSDFASVLRTMSRAVDHAENAVRARMHSWKSADEWSGGDLLALQANAYRYGEIVDVASRLVDRAASGEKTVLQGSGQ